MATTLIQRAFAGGELAPGLYARADVQKYAQALRTCRNFLVRRQGGVSNRPGFAFVAEAKTSGSAVVLHKFVFAAADESYVIECGDGYFRFHHSSGEPVTVSGVSAWDSGTAYVQGDLASRLGVNYYCKQAHTNQQPPNATYWHPLSGSILEIPTPYEAGKFQPPAPACFEQSGNVITITHLDEPPMELRRLGSTWWVLSPVVTAPSTSAPTGGAGTAGAAGDRTMRYVVTAVAAETYEESLASDVIEITLAADPTVADPNALTWDAVAGAAEYRVYLDPFGNGVYGRIGVAGAASFNDTGVEADFSLTPPIARELFTEELHYPAVSVTYQQRRLFAGTHWDREQVYASRIGFPSNFAIRSPLQADDAITFKVAGNRIQPIHHMLEVGRLIMLTDGGEWRLDGDESGTLTPYAINPRQHAATGSAFTKPAIVGNRVLFVEGRGSMVRDLQFDREADGFIGRDLCLYSSHLFGRGKSIVSMDYARVPHSILWCVRSDGTLLGLTYIPEEDVWGWHRHDTDGDFESVCVVPDGDEDAVFVVVNRTIEGSTKRYIERLASREFDELEDAFFVDSGITYDGAATTTITGLDHLEGKAVRVLADGVVPSTAVGPYAFTVSSGAITLPTAASKVHVGLAITAQLETLDIDAHGAAIRNKAKRVIRLGLLLEASSRGFKVGPSADKLRTLTAQTWDAAGLVTGLVELTPISNYTDHGRLLIQQTDPLPLTVLGLIPDLEVGG